MFPYAFTALIFTIYLEILGQYFFYRIKKESFAVSFGIGFLLLMAYGYLTTAIPSSLGWSYYYVVFAYALFFLVSIVLILKDVKNIKWKLNIKAWAIVLASTAVLIYYAYNTTLGDLNGFDTTYYLNLITSNIGAEHLNYVWWNAGYVANHVVTSYQYTFQSYFYFVSVFTDFANRIWSLLGFEVYCLDLIVWIFQILYDLLFVSVLVNGAYLLTKKKHLLNLFVLMVFLFFYGKLYYNSVFGFFGNSLRTVAFSYVAIGMIGIFREDNLPDKLIILVGSLAACSFSSSSTFIIVFLVFGLYFVLVNRDDSFFKECAILLVMPMINLISTVLKTVDPDFIGYVILFCTILYLCNGLLVKFSRRKYTKPVILVSFTLMMFLLSYKVTGNLFDFTAFFHSNSGMYDMTLNYAYPIGTDLKHLFCILFDFILLFYCIFNHRDPFASFILVLLISIFNPFCVSFLNSVDAVYYRAYDLFLNPFTFILFLDYFLGRFNNRYVHTGILVALFALFAFKTDFINPDYHHKSFIPSEDYNPIRKMNNDEYEVIKAIREDYLYRGISYPHITTPNLLTQASIPGRYTYSREYVNWFMGYYEKEIYAMFYPVDYYGDPNQPYCDYSEMNDALWNSSIDYLVVDKSLVYYDEEQELYIPLYYLVYECDIPFYENDSYSVFYFER